MGSTKCITESKKVASLLYWSILASTQLLLMHFLGAFVFDSVSPLPEGVIPLPYSISFVSMTR